MRVLPTPTPSRTRRAVALITVIILCGIALTAAAVLTTQIYADTKAVTVDQNQQSAKTLAETTLQEFEQQLANNPDFFYTETFWAERPRLCSYTDEYVIAAASPTQTPVPWPSECAPTWQYPADNTIVEEDTNATSATVRAEITPPTPTDRTVGVEIRTRVRGTAHTITATYDRPHLTDITSYIGGTAPNLLTVASKLTINGTMYAPQGITAPSAPTTFTQPDALFATECVQNNQMPARFNTQRAATQTPADQKLYNCPTTPTTVTNNIRDTITTPIHPAQLQTEIENLISRNCPDLSPKQIGAGTQARASHVCIEPGKPLLTTTNTLVTLPQPETRAAYRLVFFAPTSTQPPYFRLDRAAGDPGGEATLANERMQISRGSHPLSPSAPSHPTWRPEGEFLLPATTTITTPITTYFGSCSALFTAQCQGTAPSAPLTVIAGTPTNPADLVLNTTQLTDTAATTNLISTKAVIVPHYVQPSATATQTIKANLYSTQTPKYRIPTTSTDREIGPIKFNGLFATGATLPTQTPGGTELSPLTLTNTQPPTQFLPTGPWTRTELAHADTTSLCTTTCPTW